MNWRTRDRAAAEAANELLLQCFERSRLELQHVRRDLENPLDGAADAILQAHRRRIEKTDVKKPFGVPRDVPCRHFAPVQFSLMSDVRAGALA